MVSIDFTYDGVHYIGYEKRSLYHNVSDNTNLVQLFLYKNEQDVDTKYFSVSGSTDIDVLMGDAVSIILGQ